MHVTDRLEAEKKKAENPDDDDDKLPPPPRCLADCIVKYVCGDGGSVVISKEEKMK